MTRNKGSREPLPASDGQPQVVLFVGFIHDLTHWVGTNPPLALRLLKLVLEIRRDPFQGIGKPEPLRHRPGVWSRRLTEEHRVTYRIDSGQIYFIGARGHYPG